MVYVYEYSRPPGASYTNCTVPNQSQSCTTGHAEHPARNGLSVHLPEVGQKWNQSTYVDSENLTISLYVVDSYVEEKLKICIQCLFHDKLLYGIETN